MLAALHRSENAVRLDQQRKQHGAGSVNDRIEAGYVGESRAARVIVAALFQGARDKLPVGPGETGLTYEVNASGAIRDRDL